jgi:hypothetical protein
MRAVLLLIVMMMFLLSCSSVIADGDDRGPAPTIKARLDPTTKEAKVTQSQLDNVTFQGIVEIDQPSVTTSDLNIQAVVSTGWPITVAPSYFMVAGPASVTFEVSVTVPPGTSSLQTGNLIVIASLKAPLFSAIETKATAIVLVGQYYQARIILDDPVMTVEDGQEKKTSGSVWNAGNGNAKFQLSTSDVPSGIEVILGAHDFPVGQGESYPFSISVGVDNGVGSGQYQVFVRVVCLDEDGNVATEKEYPLTIRVPKFGIDLQAPGPSVPMVIMVIILMVAIKARGNYRNGR